MPDLQTNERRPAVHGAPSRTATTQAASSAPQSTDLSSRARRADYGIRVTYERADGVICAQVFAHLPSAERKLRRTHERGLRGELSLVRLTPVGLAADPLVPDAVALAELLADLDGGAPC